MRNSSRVPKYRKHSGGKGFADTEGRRTYFPGKHGSPESISAYEQFITQLASLSDVREDLNISQLSTKFLEWADSYYPKPGEGECANIACVLKRLTSQFGFHPASRFSPPLLKAFRLKLVEDGLSRKYVNQCVNKVKRMFRWAASEGYVSGDVAYGIWSVEYLKYGRCHAVEHPPRQAVKWEHIEPILVHCSPMIRDMVLVQWNTGCRADTVCHASTDQFDTSRRIWHWHPKHKTQHTQMEGCEVDFVIPIGPNVQKILLPYMECKGYLFSPRRGSNNRRYRETYDTNSYQQSISRAQAKAGVPHWTTHQLRHAKAQAVKARYGIEAQQAVLGQRSLKAAEIYAQRQIDLAEKIAEEIG